MTQPVVYLAGLMDTTEDMTWQWRMAAEQFFASQLPNVRVLNPFKGHGGNLKDQTKDNGITSTTTTSGDIIIKDFHAVRSANLIIAYLETWSAKRALVGTLCELAWAWEHHIPVIGITNPDNYMMRKHPFVSSAVTHYFDGLQQALEHAKNFYFATE